MGEGVASGVKVAQAEITIIEITIRNIIRWTMYTSTGGKLTNGDRWDAFIRL